MVEVADEATVVALAPKHIGMGELPARGVIVTAPADAARVDADFVSRFFAPGSGVDEDPVTGSSHCALAPFWAARFGRTELTGYQASRRGGFVHTRVVGDRVILGGQAVHLLRASSWLSRSGCGGSTARAGRACRRRSRCRAERRRLWCTPSVFMGKRSSV